MKWLAFALANEVLWVKLEGMQKSGLCLPDEEYLESFAEGQ
jgi:hypothetical protein